LTFSLSLVEAVAEEATILAMALVAVVAVE
jgi:hypothetical protein